MQVRYQAALRPEVVHYSRAPDLRETNLPKKLLRKEVPGRHVLLGFQQGNDFTQFVAEAGHTGTGRY